MTPEMSNPPVASPTGGLQVPIEFAGAAARDQARAAPSAPQRRTSASRSSGITAPLFS